MSYFDTVEEAIQKASQSAAVVFAAEGWKWAVRPDGSHVPNEEDIAETFAYLLPLARESGSAATGRLAVYVDDERGANFVLELAQAEGH